MINNTCIKALFEEFLENDPNISDATKKLYRKTFVYFADYMSNVGGDIHKTTDRDAIGYRNSLRKKELSSSTIDNYMSPIRKFFAWLNKMHERNTGYYKNEICKDMNWERDKHRVIRKLALTPEELDRLLRYSNGETINAKRNFAMINLMGSTGMRCIEVTRLTFGDIVRGGKGSIVLQVQRKGKREKGGVVSISKNILKPMERYWNIRTDPMGETSYLFVNHAPASKDTKLTPVCISRIIKTALRGIGLDSRKYSAHSLRHTFATNAGYAGAEIWEIRQTLGHASQRQTEEYMERLGFHLGPKSEAVSKVEIYTKKLREDPKKR